MDVVVYGAAILLAVFAANCFVIAFKLMTGSHSAYEINRQVSGSVGQAMSGHTRHDELDGISRAKHGVAFVLDRKTKKYKVLPQSALSTEAILEVVNR